MKSFVTLALMGLAAAGPIEHEMIKEQSRKRQTGAIAGLPAGLAGMVPMIANSGMLPTIVKTFLNGTRSSTQLMNKKLTKSSWLR
jgi:hypothetical protein